MRKLDDESEDLRGSMFSAIVPQIPIDWLKIKHYFIISLIIR